MMKGSASSLAPPSSELFNCMHFLFKINYSLLLYLSSYFLSSWTILMPKNYTIPGMKNRLTGKMIWELWNSMLTKVTMVQRSTCNIVLYTYLPMSMINVSKSSCAYLLLSLHFLHEKMGRNLQKVTSFQKLKNVVISDTHENLLFFVLRGGVALPCTGNASYRLKKQEGSSINQ